MENNKNFMRTLFKTMKMIRSRMLSILSENDINISPQQFFILKHISKEKTIIQQELAFMLKSDKSATLRQLNRLQKAMLIARIPDEQDKRKKNLVLTENGAELLKKCEVIEEEFFENIQRNIKKEEIQIFLSVLNQLQNNIELK